MSFLSCFLFQIAGPSPSLLLQVDICIQLGFCWTVLDVEIPNSSVQPGFVYTAKYSITPNDVFAGETLIYKAHLFRSDMTRIEEICVTAEVDIVAPM